MKSRHKKEENTFFSKNFFKYFPGFIRSLFISEATSLTETKLSGSEEKSDYPTAPSKNPELYYEKAKQFEAKKEYVQAKKYYKLAASLGLSNALTSLGMFELQGLGGDKVNKIEAYKLFLEAPQKGHVRGMKNLAIMLDKGDGIPVNPQEAMKWYKKVGEINGDTECITRANRLNEKLIEKQLEYKRERSEAAIKRVEHIPKPEIDKNWIHPAIKALRKKYGDEEFNKIIADAKAGKPAVLPPSDEKSVHDTNEIKEDNNHTPRMRK